MIIGNNLSVSRAVGRLLSERLELNYLDFVDYCDYINMVSRRQVVAEFGAAKYTELQRECLPHMQDFCDSLIVFDKISWARDVWQLLNNTSYIIGIGDGSGVRYAKYVDVWVDKTEKDTSVIAEEIANKLGEIV